MKKINVGVGGTVKWWCLLHMQGSLGSMPALKKMKAKHKILEHMILVSSTYIASYTGSVHVRGKLVCTVPDCL